MTLKKAFEILYKHQKWRRGSNITPPTPEETGKSIDTALKIMKLQLQNPNKIDNFKNGLLLDFMAHLDAEGFLNHFLDHDYDKIVNDYSNKIKKTI